MVMKKLPNELWIDIIERAGPHELAGLCQSNTEFAKFCKKHRTPICFKLINKYSKIKLKASHENDKRTCILYKFMEEHLVNWWSKKEKDRVSVNDIFYFIVDHDNDKLIANLDSKVMASILKLLLENGADANLYNGTALSRAIDFGFLNVVKVLLAHGAHVHENHLVRASGYLNIVKLLIKYVDIRKSGGDALISASLNGNLDVVKFLLDKGVDIHTQNDEALLSACYDGNLETVKLLLKYGANIHARDRDGLNAVNIAYENGHDKIVKLLLENGAVL